MARKRRHKVKKRFSVVSVLGSKWFWFFLLGLSLAGGLVYLLLFSPLFQVEEIRVSGNEEVGSSRLRGALESRLEKELRAGPFLLARSKSVFLFSGLNTSREIKKTFPRLGKVRIKRGLPNAIVLEVEERSPFAEVCEPGGRCFKVDEKGVAFKESASVKEGEEEVRVFQIKKEDLVLELRDRNIELGKEAIASIYLRGAAEVRKAISENQKMEAEKFVISSENSLIVKCKQGFAIYFDLNASVRDQLSNLDLLLKEKIGEGEIKNLHYIDLRFGNRVYYK